MGDVGLAERLKEQITKIFDKHERSLAVVYHESTYAIRNSPRNKILVLVDELKQQLQDRLERELRRMWSESDTQMIMAVVDEVLGVNKK